MPAAQRHAAAGLMLRLLEQPQRFEFFQAVRLAQLAGRRVRFRNRLQLAFPPSQIAGLVAEDDGSWAIRPAFMGLLGGSGALPLHYSERIAEWERAHGDSGPRAFFDMLSQRSLAMFYQAWAKSRPECMGDAFRDMLAALAGVPSAAEANVAREALAFYAAQWRSRAVPAAVMAGVLADYFGVAVDVEPLVAMRLALPPQDQAQLGVAHADLGKGVLLGARLLNCDMRARIRIHPRDAADCARFLAGRGAALQLAAMLRLACGAGMIWEVRLHQRAGDIGGCRLGADGACLGVSAWLLSRPSPRGRDDLAYLLET